MTLHRGFPTTTSDDPSARSRSRLRERPPGRERERARDGDPNQHRAPIRPERAASFKSFLASGPDCGSVSSATVAENARRTVARDSAGATKRWNAKAREGRNRKRA